MRYAIAMFAMVAGLMLGGCGMFKASDEPPTFKIAEPKPQPVPDECRRDAKALRNPALADHDGARAFNQLVTAYDLYDDEAARWNRCRKFFTRERTK